MVGPRGFEPLTYCSSRKSKLELLLEPILERKLEMGGNGKEVISTFFVFENAVQKHVGKVLLLVLMYIFCK